MIRRVARVGAVRIADAVDEELTVNAFASSRIRLRSSDQQGVTTITHEDWNWA